jgi:hypothetical protein
MEYRNITNPTWANAEQTLIDCNVEVKINGEWELVPFTANASDPEKHGRDIFADASEMTVGAFTIPPQAITDHIKAYRLKREYGGFTFGGMLIETDEKSERRVIGAWTKAKADSNYTVDDWKTSQGFVNLSNTQLIMIGDAFDAHVQKCFSAEKTVSEAHAVTPYTSISAIETAFDNAYNG